MTEVSTRPQTSATTAPADAQQATRTAAPSETAVQGEQSVDASPTLIVLTLRPNGEKFNGNRVACAQEAGFDWLTSSCRDMGLKDPDTGGEVARHVVAASDEAMGRLREIQIHVDPEHCALRYSAGSFLMERLERYAVLIDASICDGMGKTLSDETRKALAEHIDAIVQSRRVAEQKARVIKMPDGELRETTELTFVYTSVGEAGSKKLSYKPTWFEAPALHYHEGRAAGMRAAREVIQFYKNHAIERIHLNQVLHAAMQQTAEASVFGDYDKASPANVSAGFLDVIEELVRFACKNSGNLNWLDARIQAEEQAHTDWTKRREAENRELTERLRKGREAKKAKRLAETRGDEAVNVAEASHV